MDELFSGLPGRRRYRIVVELAVTGGGPDEGFLESLDSMGSQLDLAGSPVAVMAGKVDVTVIWEAADPVTALIAGTGAVAAAVRGRHLDVKASRIALAGR